MSIAGEPWARGLRLLEARKAAIPELLRAAWSAPLDAGAIARSIPPAGVVTTGAGSSAAHARYLASVLGELGVAARFVPLSAFAAVRAEYAACRCLVVFSQGLSPNARLALDRAREWHAVWLATSAGGAAGRTLSSSTEDDFAGTERPPDGDEDARRRAFDEAVRSGVRLLPFPGAGEFGTLLRIVGPMLGYAIALRFASAASTLRAPWHDVSPDEVCRAVEDVAAVSPASLGLDVEALERNLLFVASGAHTERLENLRLKFLEGTLRPAPPVWDALDLAHGPFQQMFAGPATMIAFARADCREEAELLARAQSMLEPGRHRFVRLTAKLPGPLAIFEHEAFLNRVVLAYMAERRIDACNWPGRDADAALYSYAAGSSVHASRAAAGGPAAANAEVRSGAHSHSGPVPPPAAQATRQLERLTWPDLERLLASGSRTAVLPLGSIEQHGPHLPFATDASIATEVARRLVGRLPDTIGLPVVALGCASEHLGFPGTLSLEEETLTSVLRDIASSVSRHGFARLFVFSAHGGNRRALEKAEAVLRAAGAGMRIFVAPGLGASALFRVTSGLHGVSPAASGHHAGEFETSIMLRLAADDVRVADLASGLDAEGRNPDDVFYPDLRASSPSGTVGDPRGASASRADAYLDAWVDKLVDLYRREENWK